MILCIISALGSPSKQVLTCFGCSLSFFTLAFKFLFDFAYSFCGKHARTRPKAKTTDNLLIKITIMSIEMDPEKKEKSRGGYRW